MNGAVQELIQEHHLVYEVSPYYTVVEERSRGASVSRRRVHAGFDIDVYGLKTGREQDPLAEYELGYSTLKQVAEEVKHDIGDSCSIQVLWFGATTILDTRAHLEPQAMVRLRIVQNGSIEQPAGAVEAGALKELEERLHAIGIRTAGGRR